MMRYMPGTEVVILSDRYELGLPVDSFGTVIEIDPTPFTLLSYLVFVPATRRYYRISEGDLLSEQEYLENEAESVIRDALLDFSLATRNRILFETLHPEPIWSSKVRQNGA